MQYLVLKIDPYNDLKNPDGDLGLQEQIDFQVSQGWEPILMNETFIVFRKPVS
jgi:hypothetical protein